MFAVSLSMLIRWTFLIGSNRFIKIKKTVWTVFFARSLIV